MIAEGHGISQRAREILRALVQDYIQTGEPIASQLLLARHDSSVHPRPCAT
jgi:heat-inducible transcriptional repressor